MAEKKIIWKQKTGDTTFDTLFPQTTADQVIYNGSSVQEALANIGTDLDKKFVTLDTEQRITGRKTFDDHLYVSDGEKHAEYSNAGITVKDDPERTTFTYKFPTKDGTFALAEDIPSISISNSGSGNAVTSITASGHAVTVTKGATFATTATATQSANGLMSSTDKKNLDDMVTLFGTTAGDSDKVVNTVRELLAIFNQYPEETTITQALAGKADKSALDDYVTLKTFQTIEGEKVFTSIINAFSGINFDNDYDVPDTVMYSERLERHYEDETKTIYIPFADGTMALKEDITWANLTGSGTAGGDLTGTYPNPTIATNAVTTAKIKDANVTNAKLDTTGITEGTYSVLTVNAQGRATAGANLFTIGTAAVIPASVPTNGFYLQDVTAA